MLTAAAIGRIAPGAQRRPLVVNEEVDMWMFWPSWLIAIVAFAIVCDIHRWRSEFFAEIVSALPWYAIQTVTLLTSVIGVTYFWENFIPWQSELFVSCTSCCVSLWVIPAMLACLGRPKHVVDAHFLLSVVLTSTLGLHAYCAIVLA